ncbi:MAG: alcohol dehydrogenase catalytic domain-containing protein [Dehalococcoidia bacterium]|nr:alcohol dehydrogenase catalytic domain-containing protein [Dehalococcoidia bacterium]
MAEKTLAAVLVAPREFEMRELDIPEISDDDAILKIEACGICGSDIHGAERLGPGGPKILGHENVGLIYKIGKKAAARWQVKEGDRVALEEYVPCGACKYCRSDDFRFCAQTDIAGPGPRLWYGSTSISEPGTLWGGYSQYMYMHPNAVVHKVPSNIPARHAAAFLPFSNGVEWAYGYGEVSLGDAIWIQGPGQQGLAAVIAAKAAGAQKIIVSGLSRDANRLEVAMKLGATDTIYADQEEDIVKRIMDITGGDGCNTIVNVSGAGKDLVAQAIQVSAKTKANIVCAAAGPEMVNIGSMGRKKIQIKQANGHSFKAVELAIQFIASGKLPMEDISTHTFPMSKALEAIDTVAGKANGGGIHVSIIPEDTV